MIPFPFVLRVATEEWSEGSEEFVILFINNSLPSSDHFLRPKNSGRGSEEKNR
jgi:hypothetical protein